MDRVSVDLQELGDALYDGGGLAEHRWYLDLRNGELLMVSEFGDLPDEYGELEKQPEVFLLIKPRSSREGFQQMEDYVDGLPEVEARRALERALRLPKPFRSFKDTLFDFPEERETWFTVQNQRQREAAIQFLETHRVAWVEAPPETP